jgi:RNA polymerase sigma-70 factor, ECF subfamily
LLDAQEQTAVIRGLQLGSREAWATLYDNYSADVWRYAARLIGPDAAAIADVVQDAFLEAASSARKFDPNRGTIWSWLTGIVHHRVAAHWRQASRNTRLKQMAASVWPAMQNALNDGQKIDTPGQQREIAEFVRSVLSRLPAEYAALLTAKYLDENTLADLAQQWGSSIEAMKSKLARARREFRAMFANLNENEPTSAHD